MEFNPSGVALNNGNFIGLPFTEETANIVLLPVPWEVTVSYSDGTANASENIRNASYQLDLYDADVPNAWQRGIFFAKPDKELRKRSDKYRAMAKEYIDFIESGGDITQNEEMRKQLGMINRGCSDMKKWVYKKTKELLDKGKVVGLVGGDHSTPLGYMEALAERYESFGVLHIDAHFDLRVAYEGFTYSHASIFYNALKIQNLERIVSVGIRDYCEEEVNLVEMLEGRVKVFYDHEIRRKQYEGDTFKKICKKIIKSLPDNVYISFDIDGLDPKLCPGTGTPVAGGFEFQEAMFLLKTLADSGKKIIGFDLNEVGGSEEWDGNVGARVLYKLANIIVNC